MSWEDDMDFVNEDLNFQDEDKYEDGDGDAGDEQESRPSFKELQNVHLGRLGEGAGGPGGLSSRQQKAMRSAEDAAIARMQGILASGSYSNVKDTTKTKIVDETVNLLGKRIGVLNIETLVAAAVWKSDNPKLRQPENGKELGVYLKKIGAEIDIYDLIRYIRLLSEAGTKIDTGKSRLTDKSKKEPSEKKVPALTKKNPVTKKTRSEMTDVEKAMADLAEFTKGKGR